MDVFLLDYFSLEFIRFMLKGQGFPCLFHLITGFYCPGCGGTRALILLLRGDVTGSFRYHPLVPYGAFVLGAELFFLLWGYAKKDVAGNFKNMKKRYRFWTLGGAGIVLANWLMKNLYLAAGIDLLPPL